MGIVIDQMQIDNHLTSHTMRVISVFLNDEMFLEKYDVKLKNFIER